MNNNYDDNNIFAKILKSEVKFKKIDESNDTLAFLDISPLAPIHILIIPKKPYVNFYNFIKDASALEILDFWNLINLIIEEKSLERTGFRLITNSGKDGNQDVLHFHAHLLGGKNLGKMIN